MAHGFTTGPLRDYVAFFAIRNLLKPIHYLYIYIYAEAGFGCPKKRQADWDDLAN